MALRLSRLGAPALVLIATLTATAHGQQEAAGSALADAPSILIDTQPRADRGLVVLAFKGQPHQVQLALALRIAGSKALPGPAFDEYLAVRSGAMTILPRAFGLEIHIEAPPRLMAEVVAAAGALLAQPAFSPEGAGSAAFQAAFTYDDPVRSFERQLTELIDGGARATRQASLQPHQEPAEAAPADAQEAEAEEEDGGGWPDLPTVPAPSVESLELMRGAMLLGPRSAIVAVDDGGAALAATSALLRALPPGDLPSTVASPVAASVAERTYLTTFHETPGAFLGWTAPLVDLDDVGRTALGWALFKTGPLAAALGPHLLPGTDLTVRLTEPGEGPRSVRIWALVQAKSVATAASALTDALENLDDATAEQVAIDDALALLFREGSAVLAPGQSPYAVRATRALFGADLDEQTAAGVRSAWQAGPANAQQAAIAAVNRQAGRLLIGSSEEVIAALATDAGLAPTWRLDRLAGEQGDDAGYSAAAEMLAAVGGADPWASLTSIQFRSETRAGDGQSRAPARNALQWRDLRRNRFQLVELSEPNVISAVTPEGLWQEIVGANTRHLGAQLAERLLRVHRASLPVLLQNLAAGQSLAPRLNGDGGLELHDVEGLRSTLTLNAELRPASSEGAGGTTDFFEWQPAGDVWIPYRQRSRHPPATHHWSEVEFDEPTPPRLEQMR